jgi:nitrogen-specific signal transduction histidine kinase
METAYRKKYWIRSFSHSSLPTYRPGNRIGLSLSFDIVKAHGGEIKVDTRKASTIFSIVLPV